MKLRAWGWSLTAAVGLIAGVASCATSNPDESESKSAVESSTTTTAGTSKLETVREQSRRNSRERKRVDAAIDDNLGKLTACYLRGVLTAEKERPRGRLTFRWTIDSQGRPHDVRLDGDSLRNTGVTDCVAAVLRTVRFRKPESRSVEVEYPFDFRRADRVEREGWYRRVHEAFREVWEPPEQFRIEDEDDDEVVEAKRGELRERARETFILLELDDRGNIEKIRELARSEDEAFRTSVDDALAKFRSEGEHRFPRPRGEELRRLVRANGMVLHQWMPPEEEDGKEGDPRPVGQHASE